MGEQYPECEKMVAVKDQSQAIGEFIEWLQDTKGMFVCELIEGDNEYGEYIPSCFSKEKFLAEFFNIDLSEVEKEKCQMLNEFSPYFVDHLTL